MTFDSRHTNKSRKQSEKAPQQTVEDSLDDLALGSNSPAMEVKPSGKKLAYGHQGTDVAWLQKKLNDEYLQSHKTHGHKTHGRRASTQESLKEDGIFGDNTKARLAEFQAIHKITTEKGIVGPKTYTALGHSSTQSETTQDASPFAHLTTPPIAPSTTGQNEISGKLSSRKITTLDQAKTALMDFYSNNWNHNLALYGPPRIPLNNRMDKSTTTLVRGFQVAQELPVTGKLDRTTLQTLENPRKLNQPLVGLPVLAEGGAMSGRSKDIPAILVAKNIIVNATVAPSCAGMLRELRENGFGITANNSFRATSLQRSWRQEYERKIAAGIPATYVAREMSSQHEAASAIDFSRKGIQVDNKKRYAQATAIAAKYGWNNLNDPTEPWHFDNRLYTNPRVSFDQDTGLPIYQRDKRNKQYAMR